MDIPPSIDMSKKGVEKNRRNKIVKTRASTKGVIICMYTESTRKRLQQKHEPTTKKTTRTRGFDRRVQLLVYASDLRCGGSMEWFRRKSRPKQRNGIGQVHQQGFGDHFLECFSKEKGNGYQRIVNDGDGEANQ